MNKSLLGSLLLYLLLIGCDSTFDPLQDNDRFHYSIYGYLDVSADTQWVRVMPIREQLFAEPDSIDATVSLEHLASGDSVVLKDSLFSFAGAYAWNFWSDHQLEPGARYRLTAERSDGELSRAEFKLPDIFPVPIVDMPEDLSIRPPVVYVEEIDELVEVLAIFCITRPGGSRQIQTMPVHQHAELTSEGFPNRYRIEVRAIRDFMAEQLGDLEDIDIDIDPKQVYVAVATDSWPDFPGMDISSPFTATLSL